MRNSDALRLAFQLKGYDLIVESCPSGPMIASNTSAQSSALRHIGPILSMLQHSAIAPVRGTRPNVGRRPVTPLRVAGDEIEPSVSVPMLNPTRPAAVALPGPADDPLDPCSGHHGFLVMPPNQLSPCASSPSVSFATRIAPALSSRFTTSASTSIVWSLYGPAPHVVL